MIKARLFWHIFATERALSIIVEQLHFIELQPFPVTAIVIRAGDLTDIDSIVNLLNENKIIEVIRIDIAKEFEFDTLKFLYKEADNYDYLGYFHTKGAAIVSSNTHLWRNLMNFYTIQRAEMSIQHLQKNANDFAGVFGTDGLQGQKPYIAGNFWWAKSSYIKKLPFPEILPHHTRYDCELWIGLGGGKMHTNLNIEILETPLINIAEKYETDKRVHGYIPFYELYLAQYRKLVGNLLEIGIYRGESLRLWQEALPYFVVEGIDIEEKSILPFKIYVGDQSDRAFLSKLPNYDIIIDDGGHRSKQQIISLVSKIKDTSLYVIEDLHTSLEDLYSSYHEEGEITCLEYLKQYPHLKPNYISDREHEMLKSKKIYIEQGKISPIAFIL